MKKTIRVFKPIQGVYAERFALPKNCDEETYQFAKTISTWLQKQTEDEYIFELPLHESFENNLLVVKAFRKLGYEIENAK